jgi:hypothetical protein
LRFDRPVVVKPGAAGSSHGVSLVTGEADLAVLQRADGALVVGPPLAILLDDGRLFDTEQEYVGGARFLIPAPLSAEEHDGLVAASLALFTRWAAAELRTATSSSPPTVPSSMRSIPCPMTAQSQVPKMFAHQGLTYPALLDELVRGALAAGATRRAGATVTGQHRIGDGDPARPPAYHGGTPGEPPVDRLLRTARVYAQAVLDMVVLGTGTDPVDAVRSPGPSPARESRHGSSEADW